MPLIIVTGLPCSGKSHRTQQIATVFRERLSNESGNSKRTIQVINSHHASLDRPFESSETDNHSSPLDLRDQIYNTAAREKTARAEEFSAIKRAVSRDNIVIADGLNYIKGYRYQLWCEAKAAGTRCCVVHIAAQEDECKAWNRERLRAWGREEEAQLQDTDLVKANDPSKHGKDVYGDLQPESHTALFGDRVINNPSRSRSSSIDGQFEGDDRHDQKPAKADHDGMTLKSLYIKDDHDSTTTTKPDPPLAFSANGSTHSIAPTITSIPPASTSAPPYSPSTLSSLIMRYEPPSPFSRWDTPLFTIPTDDVHPPYGQIWEAIFPPPIKSTSKKALSQISQGQVAESQPQNVRQHAATVLPQATASDALQTLESATTEVVKALLIAARANSASDGAGGSVTFSISNVEDQQSLIIPPGTILSQPMLQRLRRKYTQIQRGGIAHGQSNAANSGRKGRTDVVEAFVRFLQAEFDE